MQAIDSGKYIIPAFQRQYVWNFDKIEKLWDSILDNYPISTFLLWQLDSSNTSTQTFFCDFLKVVRFDKTKKGSLTHNYDLKKIDLDSTDVAILDGQQRLTSMYLTLFGQSTIASSSSVDDIYHCCIDLDISSMQLNDEEDEYNSKSYNIEFLRDIHTTSFKISDIMHPDFANLERREGKIYSTVVEMFTQVVESDTDDLSIEDLLREKGAYATDILNKLCQQIYDNKLIRYTQLIDADVDKALEIFIRFNAGGVQLNKTDIVKSIIESYWPMARYHFAKQIVDIDPKLFSNELIIDMSYVLFTRTYNTNIDKTLVENLKNNWENVVNVCKDLRTLLIDLRIDPSRFGKKKYAVLLPIVYCLYNNSQFKYNKVAIVAYLTRVLFFGIRINQSEFRERVKANKYNITVSMLNSTTATNVNDAKVEILLNSSISQGITKEILYYTTINNTQPFGKSPNSNPRVGYVHHKSKFEAIPNTVPRGKWSSWRKNRDLLPNLILHTPNQYDYRKQSFWQLVSNMDTGERESYLLHNCIPLDASLSFDEFDEFYKARKAFLKRRIRQVLNGKLEMDLSQASQGDEDELDIETNQVEFDW
jgi:hypothetical protein